MELGKEEPEWPARSSLISGACSLVYFFSCWIFVYAWFFFFLCLQAKVCRIALNFCRGYFEIILLFTIRW